MARQWVEWELPYQSSNSLSRNNSRAYFSRSMRILRTSEKKFEEGRATRISHDVSKINSEVCAKYIIGVFHIPRNYAWHGSRVDTNQSQGNGVQGGKIICEAEFKRVTLNVLTAKQILAFITEFSGKQTSMT